MSNFIILLLLFLASCSSIKKTPEVSLYKLQIAKTEYSLTLQKDLAGNFWIKSDLISGEEFIKITPNEYDPKVLEGSKTTNGQYLEYRDFPGTLLTNVHVAPYYGLFSYNILSKLKKFENGLFDPDCPLQTKYLVLFQINHQPLPMFGCAF